MQEEVEHLLVGELELTSSSAASVEVHPPASMVWIIEMGQWVTSVGHPCLPLIDSDGGKLTTSIALISILLPLGDLCISQLW